MGKYTVRGTARVMFEMYVDAEDEESAEGVACRAVERAIEFGEPEHCSYGDVDFSVRSTEARA